jgi:hypothetical protein
MKCFHIHLNVDDLSRSVGFTDPQGVAWEHFHTLGNIPVFHEVAESATAATACCAPTDMRKQPDAAVAKRASSCC